MKVTIEFAGRLLTVDLDYEPADGDGWNEPRYGAAFLVDDVTDEDGRTIDIDSDDIEAEMRRQGVWPEQH